MKERTWIVVLFCLLAGLPPWIISIPPAVDLPQHLAQMRLLEQVLSGQATDLAITPWYYPNILIYLPIYLFWQVLEPIAAGKAVLSLLLVAGTFSGYLLCRTHGRPVENWLISLPLLFNISLYWGFLNFLSGWPFFCLYLIAARGKPNRRRWIVLFLAGLLLYYCHALWFLAANIWLAVALIEQSWPDRLRKLSAMLPAWLLAAIWYPKLAAARAYSGVDTGAFWGKMPLDRILDADYLRRAAMGGLPSDIESPLLMLLALWIALGIWQQRRDLDRASSKPLLCAALLLLLVYFIAPAIYMNTIFFHQRWLPYALILLAVSLPAPDFKYVSADARQLLAGIIFSLFMVATLVSWGEYERNDLSGFSTAVAAISPGERVLGLDFFRSGNDVNSPTLQLFSYAQVLRKAELNFSFAEHYSGIIQFHGKREAPWKKELLWKPATVTQGDIRHFDSILLSGDEQMHQFWMERLDLKPVTNINRDVWRLYRKSGTQTK